MRAPNESDIGNVAASLFQEAEMKAGRNILFAVICVFVILAALAPTRSFAQSGELSISDIRAMMPGIDGPN